MLCVRSVLTVMGAASEPSRLSMTMSYDDHWPTMS